MGVIRKLGLGAVAGLLWYLVLLAAPFTRGVVSGAEWFPWPVMLGLLVVVSAQLSVLVPFVRGGGARWVLAVLTGPCLATIGAALFSMLLLTVFAAGQAPGALADGGLFSLVVVWLLGLLFAPIGACVTVVELLPWVVALSALQVAALSRRPA